MTKGFALTLVAVLCLAGQTPADEIVPTNPTPVAGDAVPNSTPVPQEVVTVPAAAPPMAVAEPASSNSVERWWFATDYLLGWVRGSLMQPLVTTSPAGTPLTSAGVLKKDSTQILFGNGRFNDDMRSGFKIGGGFWCDAERTMGADIGFFMLESQNTLFNAASQGDTILARPFFNGLTFLEDSQIVAFPRVASGSIAASLRSNNLYSGNIDLKEIFYEGPWCRLESIVGYRYLRFDERLTVFQNVDSLGSGVIAAGTNFQTLDNFTAHNELNAADLGLRAELMGQRWVLDLLFKMAVGRMHREITITGMTQTTVPGTDPVTSAGGMLALVSNSGEHNSNDWIVVPELGANFGWDITRNVRLHFGYDVLFWSNVARASDQISLLINPNLFPPPRNTMTPFAPFFNLVRSDLCVQTVNIGLELRF